MNTIHSGDSFRIGVWQLNLLLFKDYIGHHLESQIILTNAKTNQTVADTAYKIVVKYSIANEKGRYPDNYGYLDYRTMHDSLSDRQYHTIVR